jgi:hypothetical protein
MSIIAASKNQNSVVLATDSQMSRQEKVGDSVETMRINGWQEPDVINQMGVAAMSNIAGEDEPHIITSSALIFIPKGMKHCPLILKRVDEPIFHFSTVAGLHYGWKA